MDRSETVQVGKSDDGVIVSVPRQFTADGIIHAVVLTLGIIVLGVVVHSRADLAGVLPSPLNAHAGLLLWAALLGCYGVFLVLCLMGVGSGVLWRLGELGQRGSFIALTLYSVRAVVSPRETTITEQWLLRRRTRRIPTGDIKGLRQDECGLTLIDSAGREHVCWFSLYPPTVKRLKRELERAIAEVAGGRA